MNDAYLELWKAGSMHEASPLNSSSRLVCHLVFDYSHEQGHPEDVSVSLADLERHSGISPVVIAVDDVIAAGFMVKTVEASATRPARYRLDIPEACRMTEDQIPYQAREDRPLVRELKQRASDFAELAATAVERHETRPSSVAIIVEDALGRAGVTA